MSSASNKAKAIQGILEVEQDGIIGPKTRLALEALVQQSELEREERRDWSWITVRVDGNDLLIDPGFVTAFGGSHDSMDSGETASGFSTKDHPSFLGCALPMDRSTNVQLRGSPIPKLPWKTTVIFTDPVSLKEVSTQLIDEGPAKWTRHIGDITEAAAKQFDRIATANDFRKILSIRIVGGAEYLKSN